MLVAKGADIHAHNDAALNSAAMGGHFELVKYCTENGASIDARTEALKSSAANGHLNIVKYLVENGARVNDIADNKYSVCALSRAASGGHLDVVKYLIDAGADINTTNDALIRAAMDGKLNVVQYLISIGIDVNAEDGIILAWAAAHGHLKVVKYLIKYGANINSKLNENFALRWATNTGQVEIVKYLVEHGADINRDENVLSGPAKQGYFKTVKYLLDHGADIHAVDFSFRDIRNEAMIKYLISRGANPQKNVSDDEDNCFGDFRPFCEYDLYRYEHNNLDYVRNNISGEINDDNIEHYERKRKPEIYLYYNDLEMDISAGYKYYDDLDNF